MSQSLPEVFRFEKRILGEDRGPIRVLSQQFQNAANGNPHTADTRLAAALPWLHRNPIEPVYRGHDLSLDYRKDRRPSGIPVRCLTLVR